jgi:hypothetical protein
MTIGRIPSVDGGIQPTIVDAKGDLIVATAADTVSRLAVGTNNHVLTADSSTATGLKWAAAAGGGKVLQVVQDSTTTQESTTSTSYQTTNLSLSITPSSTSSKILVLLSIQAAAEESGTSSGMVYEIRRNSTQIFESIIRHSDGGTGSRALVVPASTNYLDSPATTSSITYDVRFCAWSSGDTAFLSYGGYLSTLIAMEIGA